MKANVPFEAIFRIVLFVESNRFPFRHGQDFLQIFHVT